MNSNIEGDNKSRFIDGVFVRVFFSDRFNGVF